MGLLRLHLHKKQIWLYLVYKVIHGSTVSGIGIAAGAANPTITSAAADGAGDWVMSAVQTLENGTTLTIENTGRTATITGDIEVIGCGDASFNLIMNVPGFMTGA